MKPKNKAEIKNRGVEVNQRLCFFIYFIRKKDVSYYSHTFRWANGALVALMIYSKSMIRRYVRTRFSLLFYKKSVDRYFYKVYN